MATLKTKVEFSGVGVHSGAPVKMVVNPAKSGGIVFRRVDLPGQVDIPAQFDNVGTASQRNTTIGDVNGAHVQTIEHLMAALCICGITDAFIEIDGPETPILDGSALEFITAFQSAGIVGRGKMPWIIVKRPVVARHSEIKSQLPWFMRVINKITRRDVDRYVSLVPNNGVGLDITATLIYPEKIIGAQTVEYIFDGSKKAADKFIKEIARARTFGKYSEWEYLKSRGMGRGANETNVIALNDAGDGTLNELMCPDEFVRHKLIDAVGDMFTSGGMIVGKLTSYKGSHAMNNLVLKKLFSDTANYDIINAK